MWTEPTEPKPAIIRTSDTLTFLNCRRKWAWSSHLRDNLGPVQHANPLWLGSGIHFALEDYHGANTYGSPDKSLIAFALAFKKKYPQKLPDDWKELLKLGIAMMQYYPEWLKGREALNTFVFNGVPQIEVNIKIPIPFELLEPYCHPGQLDRIKACWSEIWYSMQLDRVIIDENGLLWIVEYKSAAQFSTGHFLNDPQVTRYVWGGSQVYEGYQIAGVIYQQHLKAEPKGGRLLQNGTLSVAQNQITTHRMYRADLIRMYGDIQKAPADNVRFLNFLATQENPDADRYIRRDRVYRNKATNQAVAAHILMQVVDMLDPALPLYPAPNRMSCPNYCAFLGACVSMDDGSDWEHELSVGYETRPEEYDSWRECLPDLDELENLTI